MLLTMLAAVAEMERDLLLERIKAGLERARAEGKTLGRPHKTSQEVGFRAKRAGLQARRHRRVQPHGLRPLASGAIVSF
jgi:DNA invertase Pin-like site-specific DNA recombinase